MEDNHHKTLFVCNHSGGKDSQAMYLLLKENVPAENLVVIHSHLSGVEWEGTIEHIQNTISHEFHIVQAGKTFLGMVEKRGMWPSSKNRQCTSDLKRAPIQKKIIEICNTRGFNIVINCMGLRAQESSGRAKKLQFRKAEDKTNGKRQWYEWLPIHDWTTKGVFEYISSKGQKPHWAYEKGMTRLSCCFCIMGSKHDLKTAARLNPELYKKYVDLEKKIDHTFIQPTKKGGRKFLDQVINE